MSQTEWYPRDRDMLAALLLIADALRRRTDLPCAWCKLATGHDERCPVVRADLHKAGQR